MAARQGSIANFFNKKPTPKIEPKSKSKSPLKPPSVVKRESGGTGIIDFTDGTPEPVDAKVEVQDQDTPRKRRRISPDDKNEPYPDKSPKRDTAGTLDIIKIDPSTPFTYPPTTHASYPLPPSSTHNHPTTITPPPSHLLSQLAFNPNPKIILKPELNLDLLYFHNFIASGSKELYDYLLDSMPWYRVTYVTKGFTVNTPRWTTVFGKDTSKDWGLYPGGVKPRAIPEILLRLMEISKSSRASSSISNLLSILFYEYQFLQVELIR